MSVSSVKLLDFRLLDRVLEMQSGYVLDFTDRTFARFFADYGVDIGDRKFSVEGGSKAKRLRCFLQVADSGLASRVLVGLLRHRLTLKTELEASDLESYRELIARLGGGTDFLASASGSPMASSRVVFGAEFLQDLSLPPGLKEVLAARMDEAQRCLDVQAWLSAVILCGSVLEGMCLGFGQRHPELVNRAYTDHFKKAPPKRLPEWKLADWITVLGHLGILTPSIEKFGHSLREFRNYVHPAEQAKSKFTPDAELAQIGMLVVTAAAKGLAKADKNLKVAP